MFGSNKIKLAPRNSRLLVGLTQKRTSCRTLDCLQACRGCVFSTSVVAKDSFPSRQEPLGAREVIAIDPVPGSLSDDLIFVENISYRGYRARVSVDYIDPKTFGTFDMVFFFGVLYHLRHPLLALANILPVCTGTLLMQTYSLDVDDPAMDKIPELNKVSMAKFHPFGIKSGPNKDIDDPTSFGSRMPNAQRLCCYQQDSEMSK